MLLTCTNLFGLKKCQAKITATVTYNVGSLLEYTPDQIASILCYEVLICMHLLDNLMLNEAVINIPVYGFNIGSL